MSSSLQKTDYHIWQGSKLTLPIIIKTSDGNLKSLTGFDVYFYIRETPNGPNIIAKSSTNSAEILIDPDQVNNTGQLTIYFLPDDTSVVPSERFNYSIWLVNQNDSTDIVPYQFGYFFIDPVGESIIGVVRKLLDKAGETALQTVTDEIVSPASENILFVPRRRVHAVYGVWQVTDTTHSGTNYYSANSKFTDQGEITLATNLPNVIQDVRVNYLWESGIGDSTLYEHLTNARRWARNITGVDFDYQSAQNDEQNSTEQLAIAMTILLCVMTINGANASQMGYNFRLAELEIQTKLWGEGMIAQALFEQYANQIKMQLQAVGIDVRPYVANKIYNRYTIQKFFSYSGRYDRNDTWEYD